MADPRGNQESSASSSNGMHSMMIMILLPWDSFNYEHLLNTLFVINKLIPKIIINLWLQTVLQCTDATQCTTFSENMSPEEFKSYLIYKGVCEKDSSWLIGE